MNLWTIQYMHYSIYCKLVSYVGPGSCCKLNWTQVPGHFKLGIPNDILWKLCYKFLCVVRLNSLKCTWWMNVLWFSGASITVWPEWVIIWTVFCFYTNLRAIIDHHRKWKGKGWIGKVIIGIRGSISITRYNYLSLNGNFWRNNVWVRLLK